MEYRAFGAQDLPAAAALLALRHKGERAAFPALRKAFEAPARAEAALSELLESAQAHGVCAYAGQSLRGFLLSVIDTDGAQVRSAHVPYAGMAIAPEETPALYGGLYTALSRVWLQNGAYTHYVFVPAGTPSTTDAWLRLGFAYQQVYGLAPLRETPPRAPQGVIVRRAEARDQQALQALSGLISIYQAGAPVFAVSTPERLARIRQGFGEMPGDESAIALLACDDSGAVGYQCAYTDADDTDLLAPEDGIEIAVCGVIEARRGQGIGGLLTARMMREARQRGYRHAVADWRITNPRSAAFWPRQGFCPAAYRLARVIDQRARPD